MYYLLMLFSLSTGNTEQLDKKPLSYLGSVQIFYFYDSRLPSAIGETMNGLTQDLLDKQYADLVANGDIVFHQIDLASPIGQRVAQKCNITMTGLVLSRHTRLVNLTQNGYAYAKSDPLAFQQNLAFHINRLLPSSLRPVEKEKTEQKEE